MKYILFIILIMYHYQNVYSQQYPISYSITNSKCKYISEKLNSTQWEDIVYEIIFHSNSEFTFWIRPNNLSSQPLISQKGNYEIKNDTFLFYNGYEVIGKQQSISFAQFDQNDFYTLNFNTDLKTNLSNDKIEIRFIYDFESGLKDHVLHLNLSDKQNINISYSEIPFLKLVTAIQYVFTMPNGEQRMEYITNNEFVNRKQTDLPNYIDITLIEHPTRDTVNRKTKAVLVHNKLKIISSEKSKNQLQDKSTPLAFREEYDRRID